MGPAVAVPLCARHPRAPRSPGVLPLRPILGLLPPAAPRSPAHHLCRQPRVSLLQISSQMVDVVMVVVFGNRRLKSPLSRPGLRGASPWTQRAQLRTLMLSTAEPCPPLNPYLYIHRAKASGWCCAPVPKAQVMPLFPAALVFGDSLILVTFTSQSFGHICRSRALHESPHC